MIIDSIWEHKRKKTQYVVVGKIKSIRYDEEDGWIPVDFVCYKEVGTSNSECYAQPKSIFLEKMRLPEKEQEISQAIRKHFSRQESIGQAIREAQQKRVDKNILPPLERNWEKALSFSYHTAEEAMELVRELPRREWKDQEVIPEQVLAEGADVLIQLYTAMFYAGFSEEDLLKAVRDKLSAKRKDWKS